MAKTRQTHGFVLEEAGGIIVSITLSFGGRKISIGDTVTSNGRMTKKGRQGKVVTIEEPFTNGRTTDVIEVDFGNKISNLKFKDLDFGI
ncbi:MAG: hypothetical protein A2543_02265 [Candidatus Komeilibacteria bacterium RIFOXYD2_FULL_37_8]|nr:MAG: hypothetical protein A2611_03170 [Candidatus Komeilibacteria bacterium RIFOXYD1_FULL_37_29]OGY97155.1 MAG: hypothetical protein A2543_02265 [Candidatus Komeilibacteria bacterium RIFOXYD2_FULL_37_8]